MRLTVWFVALLALHACSGPEEPQRGVAGWSTLPNAYATHFKIQVRGSERRLVVLGPGAADTIGRYSLGKDADPSWLSFTIPLTRVVVVSTTHLPFFTALDMEKVVVGAAHIDQVRDTTILSRAAEGKVREVIRAEKLDRETLIALAPQAIFDPPFGHDPKTGNGFGNTIAVTEYLELDPLGRAEWIRFFGALLGRSKQADSVFKAIEHRYLTMRTMNLSIPDPPLVFFGSNWERTWYAPPGNSYMAKLITDAGGLYFFADSTADANIPVALEHVILAARECDHFGLVTAQSGKVGAGVLVGGDTRLATLDAIRKGGFYGNSAKSDLFGQALLEPEVILHDLRCIFHPKSCFKYEPTYFFPVDQ